MIGVELAGSMVVEDDVASSIVLCNRPFGDGGGPLLAKCFAPRCR
jgi:hypothetical protein